MKKGSLLVLFFFYLVSFLQAQHRQPVPEQLTQEFRN
jgi:hypothetical protein